MTTDHHALRAALRAGISKSLATEARDMLGDLDFPESMYMDMPDIELAELVRQALMPSNSPFAPQPPPDRPRTQIGYALTAFRDKTMDGQEDVGATRPTHGDAPCITPEEPYSDYDPDATLANLLTVARSDLSEFGDEVHALAQGLLQLNIWLQGGGRLPVAWQSWITDVRSENASDFPRT